MREVGNCFARSSSALGFKTAWVDGTDVQARRSFVAEHQEHRPPKMLLIGHLDTVFEKDSPFQKFERGPSTGARGPASTDMKGDDIIGQALKAPTPPAL